MTTTVKLIGKKIDTIPDDRADTMYHTLGSHHLAIVDLRAAKRLEDDEDAQEVHLAASIFTLITDPKMEDHIRELARLVYLQRKGDDQLDLGEDSTDDVIQRGKDALLTCQICLHPLADDTITHDTEVDSPDAYCTWKSDGTEVKPGQDDPAAETSQNSTSDEAPDLAGALREQLDKSGRGRKKAEPVGADA